MLYRSGDARNPLGWDGTVKKFRRVAHSVLSSAMIGKYCDLVREIEDGTNLAQLLQLTGDPDWPRAACERVQPN